eukprot:gnl/Ergobibamus_cyprinoides/1012.p2 GENE.gnl/Ergobibamus_cyprinoides/1012~~gnl/Ergobibamus_cyprinoides/1012.p2  ORF type:complete len:124 (+),score=63.76 gnl/Ergobibamus_cyprinoides/1012:156-527(+)
MRPAAGMKNSLPVILAGVLGMYGLVVSVSIMIALTAATSSDGLVPLYDGFAHLGAGLSCGFSALAAGIAIGVAGDAAVRAVARQPRLYVTMLLILVFSEALAIYGTIISLMITVNPSNIDCQF